VYPRDIAIRLLPAAACAVGLGLAPSAAAQVPRTNALVSQAHEVQNAVAEIRALPFRHAVPMAVKDRPAIRAYAITRLDREYSREDFRAKSVALAVWGFVKRPFDLRSLYEDLLAEQIGGYYDPFEGVFFIADWLPALLQKPIMAHELTHALQDQHFDLEPLLEGDKSNDDASLAGAAVVEGEGLAVMIDYALRPAGLTFESVPRLESLVDTRLTAGGSEFPVYASAPPIIKEMLLFPYLQGLLFIKAAKRRGGWETVSGLYRSLPVSTEQILWPEKYFDDPDLPTKLALPDVAPLLGPGWRRTESNVLGELGFRVLLRRRVSAAKSVEYARGWDGDRYDLYERNPGEAALVSVSMWDSAEEAREFVTGWRKVLESDRGIPYRVDRRGPLVVGLVGIPEELTGRVVRELVESQPTEARP
jgi:hypothetical protein